jgi:hypothetical protein
MAADRMIDQEAMPAEQEELTRKRPPASPYGVYPAWTETFDISWGTPLCDCGRAALRDGTHRCASCCAELGSTS